MLLISSWVYTIEHPLPLGSIALHCLFFPVFFICDLPSITFLLAAFIGLLPYCFLWVFLENSVQISVHFSHSQEINSSSKGVSPNSMPVVPTSFSSHISTSYRPFLLVFFLLQTLSAGSEFVLSFSSK